jgi:hypothetical protein
MIVKTIYNSLFKSIVQAREAALGQKFTTHKPIFKLSDDGQQAFIAHCVM